jgi:mannose-6-phosphate isomerase-like protein (cupin superfamily)
MKLFMALTLLTAAAVLCVAGVAPGATFVDHDKVSTAFAKGGPLASGPDLLVSGNHRDKAGEVEIHEKETDVIHIIDGEATFVTGGTIVGGKATKAGQIRGTDLKGGMTQHVVKGDVIVVPAGMPHWFKEVPTSVNYYVVKVLKP